jgi:tetrahydromethanopterin S-methyltransferase subunit H
MLQILDGPRGLIQLARDAGITKPLLFAPVLDLPSVGTAATGVHLLKNEFGLPSGTAPVGVVGRSPAISNLGQHAKRTGRASVIGLCQGLGADFIIYGTLARAREVFPACAAVDAAIAYSARSMGLRPRGGGALAVLMRRRH